MPPSRQRPRLQLVSDRASTARGSAWFCGHCGARAAVTPPPSSRVCERCALGLLLEAEADAAPRAGEAFLIVDAALAVQALSHEAERRLGARERDVIGRPLAELLAPAGAEPGDVGALTDAIGRAAGGGPPPPPARLLVRPANVLGVRVPARVGRCGPPRAALLVLELPGPPDPRPRAQDGTAGAVTVEAG